MLQIENTIVSLDIVETKFECDLSKCKGACCIFGDSGAPLEDEEVDIIEKIYHKLKPFLRKESIDTINNLGTFVIDSDGDKVTPLINGKECAYTYFENNIAKCSFEKAYNAGAIKFPKPVSCHLYPVRIKNFTNFIAVNYHNWDICSPAVEKGNQSGTSLFTFLKQSLTRKFGANWYETLKKSASL